MNSFLNTFTNKIDKKGRVSLPAQYRAILSDSGSPGVVLFPSLNNAAIEGWSNGEMQRLVDSIDSYEPFSDERDYFSNSIISKAHRLLFDPEGRIALPEALIVHASLGEQASFLGRGKTFQIWHPEHLQTYTEEVAKRIGDKPPQLPWNAASPKEASDD